jgi:hypothetical protein
MAIPNEGISERRGRCVIYSLHDDHVAQLLEHVLQHVAHLLPTSA